MWNGISGCDVDHDGDIDYAVTNFGLNTKYHASPDEPVVMFYGDFEGFGDAHIVEAAKIGGKLWPLRDRTSMIAATDIAAYPPDVRFWG